MSDVLNTRLPYTPWADAHTRRLPGIQPLDPADWLRVNEAYAGQMALRERLIAERPEQVHALLPEAEGAAAELLDLVLAAVPALGFALSSGGRVVQCPDGRKVVIDRTMPLVTLGRLCQEDFCLMQPGPGTEHVLTGAILCFPSGWTLSEKLGRPLIRIHDPVPSYDDDIARRVQRLFDAIRPDRPLWRANAHLSPAPLFNPRREAAGRAPEDTPLPLLRSERQCLLRLPKTDAVVFSIHTYLLRAEDLSDDQKAAMLAHPLRRAL